MQSRPQMEELTHINSMVTGNCLIVTGGDIDIEFAKTIYRSRHFNMIIGADKGVEFFYKAGITPTHIVGDFDSLDREIFERFSNDPSITVRMFSPIKDATDTELAIRLAVELGAKSIWVLGWNGKRVDHTIANVQTLTIPLKHGIPCVFIDPNNEIRLINGTCVLMKEELSGKYVSVFSLGEDVKDVTMEGFKYPISNATITSRGSRSVSNEIVSDFGKIIFREGRLILVISRD